MKILNSTETSINPWETPLVTSCPTLWVQPVPQPWLQTSRLNCNASVSLRGGCTESGRAVRKVLEKSKNRPKGPKLLLFLFAGPASSRTENIFQRDRYTCVHIHAHMHAEDWSLSDNYTHNSFSTCCHLEFLTPHIRKRVTLQSKSSEYQSDKYSDK